jgi:hypothetical protein
MNKEEEDDNVICCRTCIYYKEFRTPPCIHPSEKFIGKSSKCLEPSNCIDNWRHHKYPNLKRFYVTHNYLYWEPINKNIMLLLNDEDFEI